MKEENREACFSYIRNLLDSNKVSIPELYSEILAPTLNEIQYKYKTEELQIFEEHVYTGIILSIVESSYPYVIKESKKYSRLGKSVIIFCPSKEYHILGARMASDFFTIVGFDTTYVGNDTPESVIISAIIERKPDYIAISVTNPYHLSAVKKTIDKIKAQCPSNIEIIVGGHAIMTNPQVKAYLRADHVLDSFDDIKSLRERILNMQSTKENGREEI